MLEDFNLDECGLVPVNLATWQGFIYLNLSNDAEPLLDLLDDMPGYFERYDLAGLRRAKQIEYDVKANWKAIIENYSECYHCPGVHPQLNKITPYNLGEWLPTRGTVDGSWMPVVGEHDTLTMDGQLHGREFIEGTTEDDHKKIYYFIAWPNMLISLHPDYLMTHRLVPLAPDRTYIACEWFFEPESMADPDFDPSDAIDFWDLTNRQDWEVCELQQAGHAHPRLHRRPLHRHGSRRPRLRPPRRRPLRQRRRPDRTKPNQQRRSLQPPQPRRPQTTGRNRRLGNAHSSSSDKAESRPPLQALPRICGAEW